MGEATFLANDISIDYYSGGSGRLYLINNSVLFTLLLVADGGFPPKRFKLVFKLEEVAVIIDREPAQLTVSWIHWGTII